MKICDIDMDFTKIHTDCDKEFSQKQKHNAMHNPKNTLKYIEAL